ncbi:hypothetical protein ACIGHF_12220 [Stenotrophomonas sp. NPDC077464]
MYIFADFYDAAVDDVASLLFTLGGTAVVSYVGATIAGYMA